MTLNIKEVSRKNVERDVTKLDVCLFVKGANKPSKVKTSTTKTVTLKTTLDET